MPAQKFVDKHCLRILNMEPMSIPPNNSHHQLMTGVEDCDSVDSTDSGLPSESCERVTNSSMRHGRRVVEITLREKVTVAILCFVNLINYMDRFTIAGILDKVRDQYKVSDDLLGLLQTVFVLSYMVFAPLFGYLGDRYSRRWIMACGVFVWSLTTLLGSFMDNFYWFMFFRALVGIGEASYSTIAPTIISDLFVKDLRSKMLVLFYFAIPVGSGLGYIIGSETCKLTGQWQYALRVTPVAGLIAVFLIMFLLQDPVRGESEGRTHLSSTSYLEDIKALLRNRSFMLSTAGFTCVTFVTGALAWWGPDLLKYGVALQLGHSISGTPADSNVSSKFGIVTMISGIVGVSLGSYLAQKLRARQPNGDPLICAFGLLASAPLVFLATVTANYNISLCYTLIFFGEVLLNLNWSVVADMLLYVVVPTRRSTAEAFQILISHACGDAGSPYLVGVMSEALKVVLSPTSIAIAVSSYSSSTTPAPSLEEIDVSFHSLQYSLFMTCFVEVLGGLMFLITAFYILEDKQRACGGSCADSEQPRHIYADQTYLTNEQTENLVT